MTPQQLIGIAVRLFAIWLGISSIAYFSTIPGSIASAQMPEGNSVAVAYTIGSACIGSGLFLWFFPMLVAHKLLPRTQHTNYLSFQAHELARVGCSLLGLWLFAKALPSLVWFVFRSFVVIDAGASFSALDAATKLEIGVALFELLFALVLILKSRAFANLLEPAISNISDSDDSKP